MSGRNTPRLCAGLLAGALAATTGCTWVKVTPEGQDVAVAKAADVADCARKGKVTVSVKGNVGRMERNQMKVTTELATLARNEAAALGGDTVVAESEIIDGRQVYGVYDCPG